MVWCTDKGLGITSEILQEMSVTLEVQMNFLIFSGKKKKVSFRESFTAVWNSLAFGFIHKWYKQYLVLWCLERAICSAFPEKSPPQIHRSLSNLLVDWQRAWGLRSVTWVTWPCTLAQTLKAGVPFPAAVRLDLWMPLTELPSPSSQAIRSLSPQEVKAGQATRRAWGTGSKGPALPSPSLPTPVPYPCLVLTSR